MKKKYLLLVLVLLLVGGCEEVRFSPGFDKKIEAESVRSVITSDKPIQGESEYVTYNLPDGVYRDKEGNTIFYTSDESQDAVDISPGYIVEFDDVSVIEEKIDLQKEGLSERQIGKDIVKYRSQILETHNDFISLVEQSLDRSLEGKVRREFTDVFNGVSLDIPYEDAKVIEKLDGVKRVIKNEIVESFLMDSVPLVNADLTWDLGYTGEGIKVAIIDTGIDYTHPDLGGCFGQGCKVEGGYDVVNYDSDPMDDHFHGTHCAGIVASEDGNGVGLLGVAPEAKLYAYKVLDSGGSGYWDWVIEGIEKAVQDGVDIISMSLGCTGAFCNPNDPVSTSVDNAMDSGVVVVVAAGNGGSNYETVGSPGTARKVISVGASYKKDYVGEYWGDYDPLEDQIISFSSRGPVIGEDYGLVKPDVVAPGAIICSSRYDSVFPYGEHDYYYPCVDENHVQLAGTSMATPMTAGLVALLLQAHPNWTPIEVKMALRNNAFDLFEEFGYDINTQGYGRINSLETIQSHRPPVAYIGTSGKISGLDVSIEGSASSEDFVEYRVYYALGYSYYVEETEWIEVCSGSAPIIGGELCNWDVSVLSDGEYTLKLVVDGNDQESVDYTYINLRNVEIIEPFDLNEATMGGWNGPLPEVLPTWENILIEGTTMMGNFDHYEIEWMKGDEFGEEGGEEIWSSEEIILVNDGLQQIIGGELGEFDVSNIEEPGVYHLKLTVFNIDQNFDFHEIKIYIDPTLHNGWPKSTWEGAENIALAFLDQPSFGDIDRDGKKDIITAYGEMISVLDDIGDPLPGWPVEIGTPCGGDGATVQTGPAIADLDGDEYNEIVVGDNCGHLHVLNHDGTYVFEPVDIGGYLNTPTIADINADGELEIIVGDWWSQLHVLNSEGNYLPGWPKYLDAPEGYTYFDGIWTSPSISDLNGDGKNDIIVYSSGCNVAGECSLEDRADRLWVLDYNGNNLAGWPKDLFGEDIVIDSNIILADLNGDGMDEIVVGSFFGKPRIYDKGGNVLDGWPVFTGSFEYADERFIFEDFLPSIGDINDDGELEIFGIGYDSDPSSSRNCLYSFNVNGEILEGFPVCIDYETIYTSFYGQQVIGDLDEDTNKEVNPQHGGGRYADYGLFRHYAIDDNGLIVENFPKVVDDGGFGNIAPMSDIDGDGLNEMYIGTWSGTTFIWDLEGYEELNEWPMYQHDAQHTGNYNLLNEACYNDCSIEGCEGQPCGEDRICDNGVCECEPGLSDCSGECIDTMNDENHCGECWNPCEEDQVCLNGLCWEECIETDDGVDQYNYGETTFLNQMDYDYCIPETQNLVEFYCEGGVKKSTTINCLYGCGQGHCTRKSIPIEDISMERPSSPGDEDLPGEPLKGGESEVKEESLRKSQELSWWKRILSFFKK